MKAVSNLLPKMFSLAAFFCRGNIQIWSLFVLFPVSLWQQRWLQDKGIYIKLRCTLCWCCLFSMAASTSNILLINSNKKKKASACHPVVRVVLSLLCALCPVFALCHLFWCSNLSQVNNILCCLKLRVGNKKMGLLLLLEVPVCDFSLSFSLSQTPR